MRVITGCARGLKLKTLEGLETRPTADRVKEAEFSMIQFEIEGRNALDLFAGSGQLGIEALSRGAKYVTFVDANPAAVEIIRENLAHTGLAQNSSVAAMDVIQFLAHTKSIYDIAFIDPPYGKGLIAEVLPLVVQHISKTGVIICEAARTDCLPESAGDFKLVRRGNYGKTALAVYRHSDMV